LANKIFGIDLGTTYSCIAYVDSYDQPVVANNLSGNPTTSSVVMFNPDGSYTAGDEAKRSASVAPDRVVSLVKRHMGDADWRFSVDDKQFTAQEVSSKILEALVQDANRQTGEDVEDVVITVPAYFGVAERDATRAAGKIAGLNVVDIINEPTAAAFTYGFGRSDSAPDETILVYDLGGGTFDITVMEISSGNIRVWATDGDHELGGDNWDQRMVEIVRRKFMEENPDADDPMFDPSALAEIRFEAEAVKRTLSTTQSAKVRAVSGAHMSMVEVTRQEFEDETRELLEQTITKTHACLDAAAALGAPKIDRILLVGGSSLMPAVPTRLQDEFTLEPKLHEPNLAVAKGAALWGQKAGITAQIVEYLQEQGHDVTEETLNEVAPEQLERAAAEVAVDSGLRREAVVKLATTQASNVCSQGFGVQVLDAARGGLVVEFMIHRNEQLPATIEKRFGTVVNDQAELHVIVYEQGTADEQEDLSVNNVIVEGRISPLPPGYPQGTAVDVRFEMSNNGILVVTAQHPAEPQPLVLKQDTGRGTTDAEVALSVEQMSSIVRKA
jgi:molecular chaperone DnaK (HSP70)